MNEPDDLRARLADADPGPRSPITPVDSPRGRALLEEIMTTPIDTGTTGTNDAADELHTLDPEDRGREHGREHGWGRGWWLGAAAAAVIAVVVGAVALTGGSEGGGEPDLAGGDPPADDVVDAPALQLSLGEGQEPTASCLRPSPDVAATVELAFVGTVASVDGEQVVLDVNRWYTGGDAARVMLTAPSGMEALTGGVDFRTGQDYVVSASGGIVNYCGLSGPVAEVQPMFDAAFPG